MCACTELLLLVASSISIISSGNFTKLPNAALIHTLRFLNAKEIDAFRSITTRCDTSLKHSKLNEINIVDKLLSIFPESISNNSIFDETIVNLQFMIDQLMMNQSLFYYDTLPTLLRWTRKSSLSDDRKIALLDILGVYSHEKGALIYHGIHRLTFFNKQIFDDFVKKFSKYFGDCTPLHRYALQMLIDASRILTLIWYPYASEIKEIQSCIDVHLLKSSRYFNSPMATLSESMHTPGSWIYVAALVYEVTSNEINPFPKDLQLILSKEYQFIPWNMNTIKEIKCRYFELWRNDTRVRDQHELDVLLSYENYKLIIHMPYPLINPKINQRIYAKSTALQTAFLTNVYLDVYKYGNCSPKYYYEKNVMLNIRIVAFDNYILGKIYLCEELLDAFGRMSDKDGLYRIITSSLPVLRAEQNIVEKFKIFAVEKLIHMRTDWNIFQIKLLAALGQISSNITQVLQGNKVL